MTTPYGLGIADALEDAVGRSSNVDFADDRILVGRDECCGHESSEQLKCVNLSGLAGWGRDAPTTAGKMPALRLAPQVEDFRVLLAVINQRPFFGVVVVVDHGEDHFVHVRD